MSRFGDETKKEFISEQLDYISYKIYGKFDWYDLTPEEKTELIGVILSILSVNMTGIQQDFKEPMFKEELENDK